MVRMSCVRIWNIVDSAGSFLSESRGDCIVQFLTDVRLWSGITGSLIVVHMVVLELRESKQLCMCMHIIYRAFSFSSSAILDEFKLVT